MKKRILGLAIVLFALGGCASEPKSTSTESTQPVAAETTTTAPAETGTTSSAESSGLGAVAPMQMDPLDDPSSPLAQRVVYFDFDKSVIRAEFRDQIVAHGEYLANHPSTQLRLEGHCDERGTRAYNLALGERRAKAVRDLLLLTGASTSQIETISYGEERPAVEGHNEEAWAKNRRVVFDYVSR
ncbi:MAG: peptidoglycan-associated lipoprotein Pal [Gammaproteobacteria bacterium]|nr:peptidoglycan-associated lipoprotein Pal [Gammaproteobacteria bacterium]